MRTLLVRNAALLVTMDAQRREIAGGALTMVELPALVARHSTLAARLTA